MTVTRLAAVGARGGGQDGPAGRGRPLPRPSLTRVGPRPGGRGDPPRY